jgi:hypothetical protein
MVDASQCDGADNSYQFYGKKVNGYRKCVKITFDVKFFLYLSDITHIASFNWTDRVIH